MRVLVSTNPTVVPVDVTFLYNPACGHCRHALETVEAAVAETPDASLEVVDLGGRPEAAEEYDLRCCPGVAVDGELAYLGVPSETDLRRRVEEAAESGPAPDEAPTFARRYENSSPVDDPITA
jgi:hypothetical protein